MAGAIDLLLQTSARLFADACTPELQELVEDGGWPEELWQSIDDNGLLMSLVPESAGGIGLSWPEAVAVFRLAGAFAVPLPITESILAHQLRAEAELPLTGESAPTAASRLTTAPFGLVQSLELSPQDSATATTSAKGAGFQQSGFQLSGRAARVPWSAPPATAILVASGPANSVYAVRLVVEPEDVRLRSSASGEPVADLVFERRAIRPEDAGPLPKNLGSELLLRRIALARSAQMAGAMERILELTLEHARERQQFGRPIARFQAVQQQIAELAAEVAVTGSSVEAAGVALEHSETSRAARLAVAATKARAGEAATKVTSIAHQVHGAIGFTREHVLHRFTRRLWTWRDEAGHDREWQEQIGHLVAKSGADSLWPLLCEDST